MANSFGLTMSAKDVFFDRAAVIERIGRENARRLSKAGAFIRRRARSNLRRRKSVSMPGQTPSVYSRHKFATLKNILFALDRDWESVVIGPVRFGKTQLRNSDRTTVPQLMELGGRAQITLSRVSGKSKRKRAHSRPIDGWIPGYRGPNFETKEAIGKYQARPFMGPALEAEAKAGTIGNLFAYQQG